MTAITEVPLLGRLIEVDQKTFQTVFSSNKDAFVVGISSWGMLDYTYSKDPTGKVLLAFPTPRNSRTPALSGTHRGNNKP